MKPRKKSGFVQFIRKIEGKLLLPIIDCTEPTHCYIIDITTLKDCLSNPEKITRAFFWKTSPNKLRDNWVFCYTNTQLNIEEKNFIEYLINYIETHKDSLPPKGEINIGPYETIVPLKEYFIKEYYKNLGVDYVQKN